MLARTFSRPAVGHAEHGLVHAAGARRSSRRRRARDRRLRAFEAEALLADVLGAEEALEGLGRVEAVEDVALLVGGRARSHALDVLLDPPLLVGLLDVHVLDADRAAVGVAQHVEDVAAAS